MNRRTLLSSTVPAIGTIGVALSIPSAAAEHPDAELIRWAAEVVL